jgi:leucine-rich repeat protein SHOC2
LVISFAFAMKTIIHFFVCSSLLFWNAGIAQNNIDSNKVFTSLEEALKQPSAVYKLQLQHLSKHEIPDTIFTFRNLKWLDLSKNKLTDIPPEIGKLSKLEFLDVSRNKITSLPHTIANNNKLRILILNRNEIESLPKEIGELQSLEILDLWSNEIDQLPQSISQLKNLKKLDMRGINIPDSKQNSIQQLLPTAQIFFSAGCNCGK